MTVRARDGIRRWPADDWTAFVVLGALSAEPETLEELTLAMKRYLPNFELDDELQATSIDQAAAVELPWCCVDLIGRTALAGGGFELPDKNGACQPFEDEEVDGYRVVWLDTPADWHFGAADADWLSLVAQRAEAAPGRRIDTRAVLFGQPLLDFLVQRVADAVAASADLDDEQQSQRIRSIHAEWLMTERQDLAGCTPRQVLLRDRNRLCFDMEHRQHQWSMNRKAPPALPRNSAAYRYAGFGTIEVVMYFDLVRFLICEAFSYSGEAGITERLAEMRDLWLASPYEDSSTGMTAAEMIESERRRMPITGNGHPLHDDCPLCQAEATGEFGPMFLCFDGHHLELEDEFAFSLAETREEWEKEQEDHRRFSEEMDRKSAERKAAGEDDVSIWKTSYVNWDGLPPELARGALGFHLAELVTNLKESGADEQTRDALNGAFAAFSAATDPIILASAAELLRERLEMIAQEHPELVSKSADLQSRLDEVLRSRIDDDVPF